jgi:hypothetical protein
MELNINELTVILESLYKNGNSNVFDDYGIRFRDICKKIRVEIIKKE